jgi:hypothetical protein
MITSLAYSFAARIIRGTSNGIFGIVTPAHRRDLIAVESSRHWIGITQVPRHGIDILEIAVLVRQLTAPAVTEGRRRCGFGYKVFTFKMGGGTRMKDVRYIAR